MSPHAPGCMMQSIIQIPPIVRRACASLKSLIASLFRRGSYQMGRTIPKSIHRELFRQLGHWLPSIDYLVVLITFINNNSREAEEGVVFPLADDVDVAPRHLHRVAILDRKDLTNLS